MECPTDVNFINILCTAFALVDPENVKNTVKSSVSFYAFGIYERKSLRRMLMKWTPDVNLDFPNITLSWKK